MEKLRTPTNLILSLVLGIVSLSFFQKIIGGGIPTTRHSSLTGVPSGIPIFCSFSENWGGCFISFSKMDMIQITGTSIQSTGHHTKVFNWFSYVRKIIDCIKSLPTTLSSRQKELCPALLLAMQVYVPASFCVRGSMTRECTPFSRTNILCNKSGYIGLPLTNHISSGLGRPLTCNTKKKIESKVRQKYNIL